MRRVLSEADLGEIRDRVCAKATELLAELGCDGFNMRALAARLGVSAMTTYRYFDGKNAIFAALRVRAFDRLAGKLETFRDLPGSPLERLAALCRTYMDFAGNEPVLYGLMFDPSQSQKGCSAELAGAERRLLRALADHAGLSARQERPESNPDRFARNLWASLHGLAALSAMGAVHDAERAGLLLDIICRFAGSGSHRMLFESQGVAREANRAWPIARTVQ